MPMRSNVSAICWAQTPTVSALSPHRHCARLVIRTRFQHNDAPQRDKQPAVILIYRQVLERNDVPDQRHADLLLLAIIYFYRLSVTVDKDIVLHHRPSMARNRAIRLAQCVPVYVNLTRDGPDITR